MKILFVCESFSSRLSGGKVVRYLRQILADRGHDVRVAITSPFDKADTWMAGAEEFITSIPTRSRFYWRLYSLANKHDVPAEFSRLVDDFAPDVVHFASFDHTKSANLYQYCVDRKLRIVLQPWTMHFYCAQGFGFREGNQCRRCIEDGFTTAMATGCTSLRGAVSQFERLALRRMATRSADVVLSSNSDLDTILLAYGIAEQKIHRFPIAFDPTKTVALEQKTDGDYFIYYGQANSHKGTDFIIELFRELPDKKLKMYPMAPYGTDKPLPPNIEVVPGVGWGRGLREAIERAKAVVVPSLWATSTEYALCEAMMMRKPVIVFGVGVHKDILTDRVDAMVVQAGNREQFKAALDALDGDPSLCERIASAGAARVEEINGTDRLHTLLMSAYTAE
jgi:glycosyltransferase involved in cell wall biosynthesis